MTFNINVGIMGFSPQEEKKFRKIFAISKRHERVYILTNTAQTEPVALLIVKAGDDFVLQQQQSYQSRHKNHKIQTIFAGRDIHPNPNQLYIDGVLVPSRVFSVLDNIAISNAEDSNIENTEYFAETESGETQSVTTAAQTEVAGVLHVLVVDDSNMMQKTIQLELQKATIPLAIDFADSGEMALEKANSKRYDFVFLDVMMPGIDGFETCTQMRKIEGMTKTPIIMLTSKTSAMDEVKGLMAGCTTYLTKPFDHEEFQKMLERIMHWVKEFNDQK